MLEEIQLSFMSPCTLLCGNYIIDESVATEDKQSNEGEIRVAAKSLMVGTVPQNHTSYNKNITMTTAKGVREISKSTTPLVNLASDETETIASEGENSRDETAVDDLIKAVKQAWDEDHLAVCRNVNHMDCEEEMEKLLADKPQLARILVARKYQIDESVSLFFEQIRFRAKWKPLHVQPEDIPNALPSGAWRLCGYNKEGVVLSNYKLKYWRPGKLGAANHVPGTSKSEELDDAVSEYTKYVVYMIELMISNMKEAPVPQKFAILFDLSGFKPSLVFRKDVRLMIRKLIYVAQAQYPERLQKLYLLNAPFGFEAAWTLVQPLLDEKTASKILFAKVDSLSNEIDPSILAREYGGKHAEYPLPS